MAFGVAYVWHHASIILSSPADVLRRLWVLLTALLCCWRRTTYRFWATTSLRCANTTIRQTTVGKTGWRSSLLRWRQHFSLRAAKRGGARSVGGGRAGGRRAPLRARHCAFGSKTLTHTALLQRQPTDASPRAWSLFRFSIWYSLHPHNPYLSLLAVWNQPPLSSRLIAIYLRGFAAYYRGRRQAKTKTAFLCYLTFPSLSSFLTCMTVQCETDMPLSFNMHLCW